MKKLILVANDSPQSGKTTFAKVLEQVYERQGITAESLYTNAAAAPDERAFWDLEEEPEPTHLLRCFERSDAVILAVATGQTGVITDLFNDYDLLDSMLEFDAEICVAIPVNGTESSINGAVALGEAFSDGADYIILNVPTYPEDEPRAEWAGSYGDKVMTYLGATILDVPEFDPGMAAELFEQGMDLPDALGRRKELPRFLREAVHSWELSLASELEPLDEQLMPEPAGERSVYDTAGMDY